MRITLLSTAAAIALSLGAAPVLAQTQESGSSGTTTGRITPPATSSEAPGKAEKALDRNRPDALTEAPGKPEAAPDSRQNSTASSNSSNERMPSRQGSSSQDRSSTGSTASSSDQNQRPAADSGSSRQTSGSQQRPQEGSSQSTSTQDNRKAGSTSASQTSGDSQQRPATGSSQQRTQPSGSAAQQNGASQQNDTSSTSTSTSTTSNSTTNAVTNLNTEQRSEVTQAFSSTDVNTVSNVNFKVSVGTTITQEVRLAPLPSEVVRIVPQYRGYQYVMVRDEIVIVEPRTKKIVEVIHKSGSSRKSASVNLSSEQRKKFKTTVETTGSTRAAPSTKIEIREGVTLPQEVEIMEVPETIITEVPELRTYRYVVIGDEVALVEPETRRVIEVIE